MRTSLFKVFIGTFISILIIQCASKPKAEQPYTEIRVSNTGSYAMHSPQACYYGERDSESCQTIDTNIMKIAPGSSHTFSIRANERVRLVFPFDVIQRSAGVMYRPNCHILVDFFVFKEKIYHANAQIKSPKGAPEQGFNCDVEMYEQTVGFSERSEMTDTVATNIRYRVPREGESREGYISNYHWQ